MSDVVPKEHYDRVNQKRIEAYKKVRELELKLFEMYGRIGGLTKENNALRRELKKKSPRKRK